MKLWITLPLTLCGALYAGHVFAGHPTQADLDCWDDASCAATAHGYVVTDPAAEANWEYETEGEAILAQPTATSHLLPCTAYITIFEDGTWTGDEITDRKGKILDRHWGDAGRTHMPRWGFTPEVPGCADTTISLH